MVDIPEKEMIMLNEHIHNRWKNENFEGFQDLNSFTTSIEECSTAEAFKYMLHLHPANFSDL